ncbi:phage tail protein [Rhodococcus baikonurensis]|uniref:Gp37-like protein n=1 Tax=Rhodococcus baikonurensis TaxID=172041 RepID=UPI0037B0B298
MTTTWDPHVESRRMDQAYLDEQNEWRAPEAYVRFWSKFMEEEGVEGSYLSLQHGKKKNKTGALAMMLPHDTAFRELLLQNPDGEDAMIPITSDTAGDRWSGKVDRVALLRDKDGTETIEVSALCDWNHIATTCLFASPGAPLYAQLPRHDIKIGPTASNVISWISTNVYRQQNGSVFPIAVVPIDTAKDTSKWSGGSARFDMASPFIDKMLEEAGLALTAEMFLPEEDEQPAPEWFWLEVPTIVIKCVDKSNVTGPTGTAIDGLISWFEDLLDDGTTPVRYPNFDAEFDYEGDQAYGKIGPLGTKTALPWVWYFQDEFDGIGESEIAIHKPMASDIYVGGRSPSYVNAAIEIGIKNMLSWLGLLIGVPGLDSLYRGQLDDVFFAFDVGIDQGRVQRSGPYRWRDQFITGSEKAFTIDGQMAKRQGIHDTRGYTSHRITVYDNAPYIIGVHLDTADQIGFQLGELIFTDFVTEKLFTDTRTVAATWELTIGDGAADEDPVVKGWGRMGELANIVSILSKDVGMEADFFGLF